MTTFTRQTLRSPTPDGGFEEHETAPVSSVELSRTAKGMCQPSVKVYHADPKEAERMACEIYDSLCGKYPVE